MTPAPMPPPTPADLMALGICVEHEPCGWVVSRMRSGCRWVLANRADRDEAIDIARRVLAVQGTTSQGSKENG
jgi:hypothetical protein